MSKKVEFENAKIRLKEKHDGTIIFLEYDKMISRAKFKCLICGKEWYTTPSHVINVGTGCPVCRPINQFPKVNTEIVRVFVENEGCKLLSEYVNSETLLLIKFQCGHDNYIRYSDFRKGHRCRSCGIKRRAENSKFKYDEVIKKIFDVHGNNIELINFNGFTKSCDFKCNVCGKEWSTAPTTVVNDGTGCPACAKLKGGKTRTISLDEAYERLKNFKQEIEIINYMNMKSRADFKCKICGNTWNSYAYSVLIEGTGCPICKQSKGEKLVRLYCEDKNIEFISQYIFPDCKNINPLPFDFYLPEYNLCIEVNGDQHYRSVDYFGGEEAFEKRKQRDNIKFDYCKENNINFLVLPYSDESNIEKIIIMLEDKLTELNAPPQESFYNSK